MFGAAFQRGGESENVGLTATVQGDHIRNAESSFGERARLVEYDGVERARTLEGRAIGEVLRTRAGLLGAAHQLDHLREIRLSAGSSDAQRDRRFPVSGSTEHRISGTFLHGL